MKQIYLVSILVLVFFYSCKNSKDDTQYTNISTVTFSKDFDYYIRFIESKQSQDYLANLFIYRVPDSLAIFYQWRDSLIASAVQGDRRSFREVKENNLEKLDITLSDFKVLKNIDFRTPLVNYESSEKKIILNDSTLYLPTLRIELGIK